MPANDRLIDLLSGCTAEELVLIWTEDLGKKAKKFVDLPKDEQVHSVSAEVRSVAGHTFGNIRRGDHDLEWRDILLGVHSVLANGVTDPLDPEKVKSARTIESRILEAADLRASAAWDSLSEDDRARLSANAEEAADFEAAAILRGPSVAQRIAEVGGAAFGAFGAAKLLTLPLVASGAVATTLPGIAGYGVMKLMEPSFGKLVPVVLHLLHFNQIAPQ